MRCWASALCLRPGTAASRRWRGWSCSCRTPPDCDPPFSSALPQVCASRRPDIFVRVLVPVHRVLGRQRRRGEVFRAVGGKLGVRGGRGARRLAGGLTDLHRGRGGVWGRGRVLHLAQHLKQHKRNKENHTAVDLWSTRATVGPTTVNTALKHDGGKFGVSSNRTCSYPQSHLHPDGAARPGVLQGEALAQRHVLCLQEASQRQRYRPQGTFVFRILHLRKSILCIYSLI